MKRALRVLLGVSIAVVAASALAAEKGAGPKSVDEAWVKAMKAGDVDAVMRCYAADAVDWFAGEIARGEKAIRESYAGFLGANTVKDVVISDDHEEISGDMAARWGSFRMTFVPKAGGAPVTMNGHFSEILKKRGGRWVYIVDHASEDTAPKTPPEKT
jgi:ketosteroid isomerase-like protein